MWFVSPTEPLAFDDLGQRSSLPERFGVDFLAIVDGWRVGVQRKTVVDLIRSIEDGRLQRELAQAGSLDLAAMVVEGAWTWTTDGRLLDSPGWTVAQLLGVLWSVQAEHGWVVWCSPSPEITRLSLRAFEAWAGKVEHTSLRRRPKARGEWGKPTNREWAVHLLQSFPGLGVERASALYDAIGLPLRWTVSEKDLRKVPGIGPVLARQLVRALEG